MMGKPKENHHLNTSLKTIIYFLLPNFPHLSRGQSSTVKANFKRFPLSYLSNYLKCLLCFGCGDIVTTMKTLLKQEDRKFIRCSPSPLQKAQEHYLKMQTVIFCDKIKETFFFF